MMLIKLSDNKKNLILEAETLGEAFDLGMFYADNCEKIPMSFSGQCTIHIDLADYVSPAQNSKPSP